MTSSKKWICVLCGFIYDEAVGLPEEGIAPGTAWSGIPDDFECPDCGFGKADFEMVAIETQQSGVTEDVSSSFFQEGPPELVGTG